MAKAKKIEMKTEIGVVTKVGFRSTDRTTVLYMVGGGISQGVEMKVVVDTGEYSIYDNKFSRELIGKKVEYSYEDVTEMRAPVSAKFVRFVE